MNRYFAMMDHVRYTGTKLFSSDKGEAVSLNGKIGEIVGRVGNTNNLIVEFSGMTVRCSPENLERQSFKDDGEYDMRRIERKWKTNDEGKDGGKKGKNKQ